MNRDELLKVIRERRPPKVIIVCGLRWKGRICRKELACWIWDGENPGVIETFAAHDPVCPRHGRVRVADQAEFNGKVVSGLVASKEKRRVQTIAIGDHPPA